MSLWLPAELFLEPELPALILNPSILGIEHGRNAFTEVTSVDINYQLRQDALVGIG